MKLSELIKKLETAFEKYGDMEVLMESQCSCEINGAYRVGEHIRLTDLEKPNAVCVTMEEIYGYEINEIEKL